MRDTILQDSNSRGWYKPEGHAAAFLAEAPSSSAIRYSGHADPRRYDDTDRSWYRPRAKSEKPFTVSNVASETNVSPRTVSFARRFYDALKGYLT